MLVIHCIASHIKFIVGDIVSMRSAGMSQASTTFGSMLNMILVARQISPMILVESRFLAIAIQFVLQLFSIRREVARIHRSQLLRTLRA